MIEEKKENCPDEVKTGGSVLAQAGTVVGHCGKCNGTHRKHIEATDTPAPPTRGVQHF